MCLGDQTIEGPRQVAKVGYTFITDSLVFIATLSPIKTFMHHKEYYKYYLVINYQ